MPKRKAKPKTSARDWSAYDTYRFGYKYKAIIECTNGFDPNVKYRVRVKTHGMKGYRVLGDEFKTSGGARHKLLVWIGDNWPYEDPTGGLMI